MLPFQLEEALVLEKNENINIQKNLDEITYKVKCIERQQHYLKMRIYQKDCEMDALRTKKESELQDCRDFIAYLKYEAVARLTALKNHQAASRNSERKKHHAQVSELVTVIRTLKKEFEEQQKGWEEQLKALKLKQNNELSRLNHEMEKELKETEEEKEKEMKKLKHSLELQQKTELHKAIEIAKKQLYDRKEIQKTKLTEGKKENKRIIEENEALIVALQAEKKSLLEKAEKEDKKRKELCGVITRTQKILQNVQKENQALQTQITIHQKEKSYLLLIAARIKIKEKDIEEILEEQNDLEEKVREVRKCQNDYN
ncbi:dynein regulatory complex subunit 4-like [Erpetoichthys calabaricus]|uniref:dynein regulatory complex subunit 4-like n=1 Tax=Erpetoichthys calabaricus TaxID=27687 RepID=UPI00223422C4|nr:dynein regulatory complex subunit 4-like [Erpetoichthys calabaricus]